MQMRCFLPTLRCGGGKVERSAGIHSADSGGGGDSSSASGTSAGTGSVALLLTDAPSDIFEEINITVIKAEMFSDDDEGGKNIEYPFHFDRFLFSVNRCSSSRTATIIALSKS